MTKRVGIYARYSNDEQKEESADPGLAALYLMNELLREAAP